MSYVTNTFIFVRSSVRSKHLLCFVHGQGQKSEQKPTTKNFVGSHNHSRLLVMNYIRVRTKEHLSFSRGLFYQGKVTDQSRELLLEDD